MLKKLVALTLAALMLINPMTAMAVTWDSLVENLRAVQNANNGNSYTSEDGVTITEEENQKVVISGDGEVLNFYHNGEFKTYEFTGKITLGGEEFSVYVHGDEKVVVNVAQDVVITAADINLRHHGEAVEVDGETITGDLTVTIKGQINNLGKLVPEYDEKGNPILDKNGEQVYRAGNVHFSVDGDSNLTVTFGENSKVESEEITFHNSSTGEMNVTNNGELLSQSNVGVYADGENATGTTDFVNNGKIETNINTEDDIYDENVEDDHIGGFNIGMWDGASTDVTITNYNDIIGNSSGWLNNTNAGAGITYTNDGTITGDVGVWGQSGEGAIELENSGTVEGNLGTNSHDDISLELSNSGKVEGEMFADNQSSKDMTVTNSGDTNGLSVGNANAENVTVINSGNVTGGETRIDGGAGTVTFENTGTIEGERFDLHAHTNGTVTGTNSGTIDVEWGYVGSSENGNVSFTNESDGSIHTDENFDLAAGKWNGEEDYEYNPENSSTTSFVNKGEIVTEGSFHGNLQENGSITLENTETGTMTAVNEGIHVGINDNGHGSVSVNNAGTVNSEWFNVGSETTGTASITNTGTVNGYMGAYADGDYDDEGNMIQANKDGVVSITNHGTVTDGMGSYVNGGGTGNVVNTGDVTNGVFGGAEGEGSISVDNSGTAGDIWVDISGEATGMMTNTGDAAFGGGHAGDDANITINNEGTLGGMDVFANGTADMNVTNNGDVTGFVGVGTAGEASGSFENNGFVDDLYTYADEKAQMDSTNNGEIAFKYTGFAYGDGQVTINNSATGVIGDSEQDREVPDGLWGQAEGGNVIVNNEGTINGEIGGVAYEGTETTINNNGSADTAWINAHGGNVALNNEGTVSGTLSVSIGTQGNAVTDETTVAQLLKQTGIDISGYENVDIYTANPDGELIARYSVDENGKVTLEEVLMEEDNGSDDPRFWTDERIRHHKEMERKAAAIGGVTGSPYWVKSLYLGYMSLNLRLFDGEDQLLFKENLSWVPGTGVAGEKVLTLNVKTEDTSALTMRLDGMVINKLKQAGIVTINIVDGAGNLFMEYKVEDLKGARELYGLTEKEYIVVGAADADVMKIAEDGTISPIEGEEEPAEEVAEEAEAETEAQAAEETPAA